MMRAQKLPKLLLAAGILFGSLAFVKPFSFPVTSGGFSPEPVISELSVIDPEVYDAAQTAADSEKQPISSEIAKSFIHQVSDGNSKVVRGIFSDEEFALPVIQQPSGNAAFVSTEEGVVTEFSMARNYGVTGIVAHNYLAGAKFFNLEIGEVIYVILGDGSTQAYKVTNIQSYQALSPNSPTSQFVDLSTSEKISSTQLFKRVYMGSHHLTLQTCIQQGNEDSWGRLFVIAEPI